MDQMNMQPDSQAVPGSAEVGKLFRSALKGFNRQDVTEYIERMARDRRRDAERYGAHIRTQEEERTETTGELESLRNQVAELVKSSYEAGEAKETAERELAEFTKELEELRAQKTALETEKTELESRLAAQPVPVPQDGEDKTASLETALAKKDEELAHTRDELEQERQETARLRKELETLRSRMSAQNGAAALISRVRPHGAAQAPDNGAMQQRIDRARLCVQEGISECSALYREMHRNIERLEEILRNLND